MKQSHLHQHGSIFLFSQYKNGIMLPLYVDAIRICGFALADCCLFLMPLSVHHIPVSDHKQASQ